MTLYFFKEKATLMYVRLLVVAAFLYAFMMTVHFYELNKTWLEYLFRVKKHTPVDWKLTSSGQ